MQIIIDIPEKLTYEGFERPFTEEEKDILIKAIGNGTPLPRCKDCKYFEYDSVVNMDGIPLIVAHEICSRWGDGCKSREDGYCFLFEPKEEEDGFLAKRRKRMSDILVIQAPYAMKKDAMKRAYDVIFKQMKSGLVMLPAGFSVALCPKDVEVKFMDSNNDIFKEDEENGT